VVASLLILGYDATASSNAELAVSSIAVAETIATTHCAYPLKNGQAAFISFLHYCSPSSGFYGARK